MKEGKIIAKKENKQSTRKNEKMKEKASKKK